MYSFKFNMIILTDVEIRSLKNGLKSLHYRNSLLKIQVSYEVSQVQMEISQDTVYQKKTSQPLGNTIPVKL